MPPWCRSGHTPRAIALKLLSQQHLKQVVTIQGARQAFTRHTFLARLLSPEIERAVTQHRKVLWAVPFPEPTLIFPKGDSQGPLSAVLNPPRVPDGPSKLLRFSPQTPEGEALRHGGLSGERARRFHPPYTP